MVKAFSQPTNTKTFYNYIVSPTYIVGFLPKITFKSSSHTGSDPNLAKVKAEKNLWHRSSVSVYKI